MANRVPTAHSFEKSTLELLEKTVTDPRGKSNFVNDAVMEKLLKSAAIGPESEEAMAKLRAFDEKKASEREILQRNLENAMMADRVGIFNHCYAQYVKKKIDPKKLDGEQNDFIWDNARKLLLSPKELISRLEERKNKDASGK